MKNSMINHIALYLHLRRSADYLFWCWTHRLHWKTTMPRWKSFKEK